MSWQKFMNVSRFTSLLATTEFDVVVASSLRNVNYTSGAWLETQRRIPLRLALTVLPRAADPTLIVCTVEESLARAASPITDLRTYFEFQESPIELLAQVLREKGLDKKTIGIEKQHLMAIYYEELQRRLPQARLLPADGFFDEVRMIKTPLEIETIKQAGIATEKAIFDAFATAKPGDRERDLGFSIRSNLLTEGADSIRFLVLGAGQNSLHAHHIPGDKPLLEGELVRIDCGGYFGAYASDVARMAVIKKANPAISDIYRQYRDIQRGTIAQMNPGTRISEVYNWCKDAFEKRGMPFHFPHVGHGTGVDGGHEEPLVQPLCDRELEPNMLFYIEPVYSDPNIGAFHVEDLVLITESGPQILTTYSETDKIFVIK